MTGGRCTIRNVADGGEGRSESLADREGRQYGRHGQVVKGGAKVRE